MRPNVYEFVKEVRDAHWASGLPVIVHEIGSYRVGNDPILRDLFPNTTYRGIDMRAGPNVDTVCDVEDYGAGCHRGNYPDMILCCDTLEHVERPWKAVKRMQQALASQMGPDLLVVTVPFMFGVHSHPNDYWRFTTEGLKTLFDRAGFANFAVGQDPAEDGHPHTVVGVASNGLVQDAVREVVAHGSWRTNRRSVVPVPTHQAAMAVAFDTEEELADFEREVGPWWEKRSAELRRIAEIAAGTDRIPPTHDNGSGFFW